MNRFSGRAPFPPPLVFVLAIALGWLLQRRLGISFVPTAFARLLGGVVVAAGVALAALSVREFRRFQTSLRPDRPSTAVALWLNNFWILLMLIPAIVVTSVIIKKEERYLDKQLGTDYTSYRASDRRCL